MKFGTLVRIGNVNSCDEKFKTLYDMGFTACQIVYKPETYKKEDAEIISASAQKNGIDISAMFCGFYDEETVWDNYEGYRTSGFSNEKRYRERIDYVKNGGTFASQMGVTDIVCHIGFVPNNPFSADYEKMLSAVCEIAEHLKKIGSNLLIETGPEAPITVLRLIEDSKMNNIFINLDPANIYMYGYGNPCDALRVYGKYVRNMHGKDGCLPTTPKNIGVETKVGEGMVDFKEIFRLLKELNYDRYIIIEREITGDQQAKDILFAKEYLENLWNN